MHARALTLAALAALAAACAAPTRRAAERRPAKKAQYRWINPLLECSGEENALSTRSLRATLKKKIDADTSAGRTTRVALYFRDLNNGPIIAVDEDEPFLLASLLKVPMMVAVLREAERNPLVWTEPIAVPTVAPMIQRFAAAPEPPPPGATRPVAELVEAMIRRSDNAATAALAQRFGTSGVSRFYDEISARLPGDGVPEALGIETYSAIFRLLYNATYLDRRSSELALDLLARTEFADGLAAPLPRDVPIAHKHGERGLENGEKQLHDCGIVYYPEHPYILCVMTRGRDWDALARTIQDLSELVYGDVSRQFPRGGPPASLP